MSSRRARYNSVRVGDGSFPYGPDDTGTARRRSLRGDALPVSVSARETRANRRDHQAEDAVVAKDMAYCIGLDPLRQDWRPGPVKGPDRQSRKVAAKCYLPTPIPEAPTPGEAGAGLVVPVPGAGAGLVASASDTGAGAGLVTPVPDAGAGLLVPASDTGAGAGLVTPVPDAGAGFVAGVEAPSGAVTVFGATGAGAEVVPELATAWAAKPPPRSSAAPARTLPSTRGRAR